MFRVMHFILHQKLSQVTKLSNRFSKDSSACLEHDNCMVNHSEA